MEGRNYLLDTMKFFCAIAVVCIHTQPWININNDIYLVINTLCRVAVPLFFICSGYLFYSKFNNKYSKKYLSKITKLLASWSLFYIGVSLGLQCMSNIINGNYILSGVKEYFLKFRILDIYYGTGIIEGHLWYLSATILVIPILYFIIKYNYVTKALIISLILNIIGIFMYNTGNKYFETNRDAIFFALFYCIVGVYIKLKEEIIREKLKINKIYMLYIGVFTLTSIYERYIYNSKFIDTSDCYISTIPLSILIFVYCIINKQDKDTISSKIGKNSIGIYLVHVAYINLIDIALFKTNLKNITSYAVW